MPLHPRTPWSAAALAGLVTALGSLALAAPQTPTAAGPLVERAAAYVAEYARSLSSVVADERYDQWLRTGGLAVRQPGASPMRPSVYERRRRLDSDYVLVKVDGPNGWVPFRDVVEVDGRPVENHGERLATLALKPPTTFMNEAERLTRTSARFFLGDVPRAVNMPVLALMVVSDLHRSRFEFTPGDDRRVAGLRTQAVDYRELYGPTLVRGAGGSDLRASGTLWIEPDTGTVVRSVFRTADSALQTEITVSYRLDKAMELYVPEKMEEVYKTAGEHVEGEATYSNFRRFKVDGK